MKRLKSYSILIFFVLFSCATPGERIKKEMPDLYQEMFGTWYILSNQNFGQVEHKLIFNEDGTIMTDLDLHGSENLVWANSGVIFSSKIMTKGRKSFPKGIIDRITLYDKKDIGKGAGSSEIVYGHNITIGISSSLLLDKPIENNSIYKNYLPPLYDMNFTIKGQTTYYVFTKDISLLSSLSPEHGAETNNVAEINNEDETFNKLNKTSLQGLHDFIITTKNDSYKDQAQNMYDDILNQKSKKIIKTYFNKNLRKYKSISDFKIYDPFGKELGIFSDIFRIPALSKKDLEFNVTLEENPILGIEYTIENKGIETVIYFKKSGTHLIYHAVKGNDGVPRMVQNAQFQYEWDKIITSLKTFPSFENLDSEVIKALSK